MEVLSCSRQWLMGALSGPPFSLMWGSSNLEEGQNLTISTKLVVASPYLPMQYNYNDFVPSQSYYAFAQAAGCLTGYAVGSPAASRSIFECLVAKDTAILQNASASISSSGM